jgi:hypothetical protein
MTWANTASSFTKKFCFIHKFCLVYYLDIVYHQEYKGMIMSLMLLLYSHSWCKLKYFLVFDILLCIHSGLCRRSFFQIPVSHVHCQFVRMIFEGNQGNSIWQFLFLTVHFQFSYVWFDHLSIFPDVPEHVEALESIGRDVTNFILQQVVNISIPEDHIIVAKTNELWESKL